MFVAIQRIEKVFRILLFLFVGNGSTYCQAEETTSTQLKNSVPSATIKCRVVDGERKAIAGAMVEVLKWTGSYDRFTARALSDADGQVELTFPYSDDYFHVLFSANGYAVSMHSLQISADETQQIEFQLSPAAKTWLRITADGQPLSGAEVASLNFVDCNQSTVYLEQSSSKGLGFHFSKSNEAGRLNLPDVPEGATLNVSVVHPKRSTAKLEGLVAAGDKLADVELETGVSVTIKLSIESQDIAELEGVKATISMLPSTGGSSTPTSVRHEFPICDGLIRFTASAVNYNELRFKIDDYFSTPLLMNYSDYPMPELNLTDGQPATLELKLRRRVKTRGRVVDAQGNGVADAYVRGMIANNSKHENDGNSDQLESNEAGSSKTLTINPAWASLKTWSLGGDGQTDADGNFEIDLAAGPVKLEVIREGYFSSPPTTEAVIVNPETQPLPEMMLHSVPELTGRVVDATGQPVIGAIVRMRHHGSGDADPVGESSA
ncbi:MAG: carboxypeptidase-like regulatory domain-containing protein, partial [Aureliella sp.]